MFSIKNISYFAAAIVSAIAIHNVNSAPQDTGTTLKVIAPPPVEEVEEMTFPQYCFPKYQRLTLDTYNLCIHKGMTYVEVANIIGVEGDRIYSGNGMDTYRWGETGTVYSHDGVMSVNFKNGKLTQKSQVSLDADYENCFEKGCINY